VVSVVIEDKKPVKSEKTELVDETDIVRRGYVRKSRSSAWTNRGRHMFLMIYSCLLYTCMRIRGKEFQYLLQRNRGMHE